MNGGACSLGAFEPDTDWLAEELSASVESRAGSIRKVVGTFSTTDPHQESVERALAPETVEALGSASLAATVAGLCTPWGGISGAPGVRDACRAWLDAVGPVPHRALPASAAGGLWSALGPVPPVSKSFGELRDFAASPPSSGSCVRELLCRAADWTGAMAGGGMARGAVDLGQFRKALDHISGCYDRAFESIEQALASLSTDSPSAAGSVSLEGTSLSELRLTALVSTLAALRGWTAANSQLSQCFAPPLRVVSDLARTESCWPSSTSPAEVYLSSVAEQLAFRESFLAWSAAVNDSLTTRGEVLRERLSSQLCESAGALLGEAGTRRWAWHRPWFKGERGGHYLLAWGSKIRWILSRMTAHGVSPDSVTWIVSRLVADGAARVTAIWGCIAPSRVQMPQLGIDSAYAVAAFAPLLRVADPKAAMGVWNMLWVGAALTAPPTLVAERLRAQPMEGAPPADPSAVTGCLDRMAETLRCQPAVWSVSEEDGMPLLAESWTSPAAESDAWDRGTAHSHLKALGAVGSGAGFAPPRFGKPKDEAPPVESSPAMWEALFEGPCPLDAQDLAELVRRRQDVATWAWPKATADDTAAHELLTGVLRERGLGE
jgi:hypothetical protein